MWLSGERLVDVSLYVFTACAVVYATLSVYIVVQAQLAANRVLAFSCLVTSIWAIASLSQPQQVMSGVAGSIDMIQMLTWYSYLLFLYIQSGTAPNWHIRSFVTGGIIVTIIAIVAAAHGRDVLNYSLFSSPIAFRLILPILELLLIENLFLNVPEHARWHVALPCILLGCIACLDILMTVDAVLLHRSPTTIAGARTIMMVIIAPLLIVAAARGQKWSGPVKLSKTAVFHSATLVLSGLVLVTLGIFGEILRYLDSELGWLAELTLFFGGALGLLIMLTSRSARSFINRVVIYHFFADRFDYRIQWLRCIATLSGTATNERTTLPTRAIRAIADVVDSPTGSLFLRDISHGGINWAGSWNTPAGPSVLRSESFLNRLLEEEGVVELDASASDQNLFGPGQVAWLAVPLLHTTDLIGLVVVSRPRTQFKLDQEVFDLLSIIGREVATHVVERQATESLHRTKHLSDFGNRFAFVAHDIKNVSSQLALLIQNAETYLADPEFQLDMLQTVRSSVTKIEGLLKRLDQPCAGGSIETILPWPYLNSLVATYRHVRRADIVLTNDGSTGEVLISPHNFEAVITHLINNAVEAEPAEVVRVSIEHEAERVIIEIVDQGPGMSPTFIRDQLFIPFQTNKPDGSGIGAYQARELLREAGGQLIVLSEQGKGTTMRIVLARADRQTSTLPQASSGLAGATVA